MKTRESLDWYPDHRIQETTEALALLRAIDLDEEKYEFGLLTTPKVAEHLIILNELKYQNITRYMFVDVATLLQCVGEDNLNSFYLKFAN